MDGTTTTFGKQHGVYLSRKVIALIAALFVVGIIATGLLAYNLTSCPSEFPESNYHHQDYHNKSTSESSSSPSSFVPSTTTTTVQTSDEYGGSSTPEEKIPEKLDVRLPRSIIPKSYHIKIIPFIFDGNFTFSGVVDIVLNVLDNTRNVTLHIDDILYDDSSISLVSLSDNSKIHINKIDNDSSRQFLVLHLEEFLIKNKIYKLHIKYTGVLNDILQGFYRSSYQMGNQTRWIAATQFQPTDARRAFPCFDEPAMKATFQIDLARPKNMTTLSNMPRRRPSTFVENLPGYVWDYYQESVPMSTYLVAFAVTDFANLTDGNFSVWARKDAINQANYSLFIGPKILKHYEHFFQIPFPLPKIDMIALPDFSAGAMENWGLITYRETAMLYQEGVSTSMNLQRVATVIAHELAHQWFGNLVTPTWWSDLWLNEGFATYVEYIGADAVEPEWKILDQFVIQQLQYSFALDALTNSHQISIEVGHPDEINDIFDRISYAKGASVIRMMNHFLTTPVFKKGLTNYLHEKTYSNAEQNDLWAALTAQAHKDKIFDKDMSVKDIMDTWTLQTGFPVVNVKRNYPYESAVLTQERFLLLGNGSESESQHWWVPITFTNEREVKFENVSTKYWIKNVPSLEIPDMGARRNEWVIVNIQETGYYRVNYDEENWKMLIDYLMNPNKFKYIGTLNRAQLLDDALNLARAGKLNYQLSLNLTRYLVHEKEYVPWQAGFVGLSYLGSMFIKTGNYDLFKHFMFYIIKNQYKEIGFDEKPTDAQLTIYKRVDLLYWACTLGQNDCVRNSVTQFQNWKSSPDPDNNNPISPNLKNIVYCTALRVGGQDEWEFAWQRYLNANVGSEKEILMIAMGCSRETWILSRYLSRAITENSGIRKQDAPRVFAAVASNEYGQDLAFNFLRSNWLKIKEYMGSSLSTINSIVRVCTKQRNTAFDVKNLKDFEEEYRNDLGTAVRTLKQAIEDAEANVKWMNENYDDIVEWLKQFKKTSLLLKLI